MRDRTDKISVASRSVFGYWCSSGHATFVNIKGMQSSSLVILYIKLLAYDNDGKMAEDTIKKKQKHISIIVYIR